MLASLKKMLPKSQFMRSVSVLTSAEAVSQLIVILSSPILMRLYSPSEFGGYAVFVSLLTMSLIVATLRFEMAIPLPEGEDAAINLVGLVLGATVVTSLLSVVAIFFCSDFIAGALRIPQFATWLWALPVMVLLGGIYQAYYYYSGVRHKSYGAIATTRLSRSIAMVGIQIVGHALGGAGLLLGQLAGMIVGLRPFLVAAKRVSGSNVLLKIRWQAMQQQARTYRDFPLWTTWASILNSAGLQLPTMFFAALFSPAAAGLYALTHRVLSLPVSILGQAVANVFLAEAADAHREGRLQNLVRSIVVNMIKLGITPTVTLMLAGPLLFEIAFGQSWREAGEISRYIAPWLLLVFITTSVSRSFAVLGRNRYAVVWEAILLVVRIAAIGLGYYLSGGDFYLTVMAFALASAVVWLGMLIACLRLVDITAISIAGDILKILPMSALVCLPVAATVAFNKSPWIVILGCVFTLASHAVYLMLGARKNAHDAI